MRGGWGAAVAAIGAAAALGRPALATTYTVATNGSDSGNGVSAPFRSVSKAYNTMRDGDSMVIRAGTYTAGFLIRGRRNVSIRGEGDVTLLGRPNGYWASFELIDAHGVTMENLNFANNSSLGIYAERSDRLTFRNCEFTGNGTWGMSAYYISDVIIENCAFSQNRGGPGLLLGGGGDRYHLTGNRIFNNGDWGLQIDANDFNPNAPRDASNDGLASDCVLEGNTLYGNGSGAFDLRSVRQSLLVNNLIYGNRGGGIGLSGSPQNRLFHNTVVFPAGAGLYGASFRAGSSDNQLVDNILVSGSGPALAAENSIQSDYNILSAPRTTSRGSLAAWQQATGDDRNSFEGDPRLGPDYRPVAGSPAIDAGTQVYNTDKDGRLRPQGPNPDCGCYEVAGAPQGGSTSMIFEDALHAGWRLTRSAGALVSYAVRPAQGQRSIAVTLTRSGSFVQLSGTALSLTGKTALKLMVNGGTAGGQEILVAVTVPGASSQILSLSLYGGAPPANAWKAYSIPLADLGISGGSLTAVKLSTTAPRGISRCYVDSIRLE